MKKVSWAVTVVLGIVLAVAAGCTKPHAGPADAAAEVLGPVPAPAGLLAAGVATTPDDSWRKLQRMSGGVTALLPPTFGGVLCALGGLDAAVGAEIDGGAPAYVSLSGSAADPAWVIAARLASPARARGVLVDGEAARYGVRVEDGLSRLVAKGGSLPGAAAVTSNGWLLVAKDEAALKTLASYTYRTLPAGAPQKDSLSLDVPGSAFAGLAPLLRAGWAERRKELAEHDRAMRERSGRAPDFGDPEEILAQADAFVSGRIDEVGDVASARLAVDVGDASVFVGAELVPKDAKDGPFRRRVEAMPSMGPEPLLGATADCEATLAFTDAEDKKGEDLTRLVTVATATMGARLGDADKKRLAALAADWKAGRGKIVTMSAIRLPAKGLLATTKPDDRDALVRALRGAADVLRIPNVREALRMRDVATEKRDDPKLGKVEVTAGKVSSAAPPGKKVADRTYGLAWAETNGEVAIVAGEDPAQLLTTYGRKERRLGDDDAIKLPIERVAKGSSVAVALQPFKLDPSRLGAGPAPVVLGWGQKDGRAVLRTEISGAALSVLAKRQLGL